ncbi:BspA family leucine-rich repeat surface protein, partial [Candidatus Saccharibacteria bacterium]|nr:BspA family leucine-rich repeat surface protein [Candidatus Saccharibacteria bacterium]
IYILTATILTSLSFVSFLFLASSSIFASDHVSNVSVTVPVSCNISSTLDTAHTATINPGQVKADIGTTTFKVFCNDNTGYAIYAIGYSGDEYGNTNMLPTNPTTSTNPSIVTGTATSGDTSNWAMKIAPVDGTYKPTIESDTNGSFSDYHIVPDTYTKVATLTTNTDFTIGSSFQSTYRVFVSQTQPADTYTGKVKYTLVHPNDANPPKPEIPESQTATLKTGQFIYPKISAGYSEYGDISLVKQLPEGFTPTDENTLSVPDSPNPVYIYYDDTDYSTKIYTLAKKIYMNADSSYMFYICYSIDDSFFSLLDSSRVTNMQGMFKSCVSTTYDNSLLANWDVSNVTNMSEMFGSEDGFNCGVLSDLSPLANWDVSSVTNMGSMFDAYHCGGDTSYSQSLNPLSNWDTSNVTDMSQMFRGPFNGYGSFLVDINALANWDTSSVVNMNSMFANNSKLTNIDALKDWDTSSVTNMGSMFSGATSLTNINGARNWNTGNVTNINYMFYRVNNIDATVLNNWNVSKVAGKIQAFTCPANKRPSWY